MSGINMEQKQIVTYKNGSHASTIFASVYSNTEGEPGNDCDDHGPYADDDCPKC